MIPLRNIRRFFNKALRQPVYALKVFKRRFRAQVSYKFGKGKSNYPEALTFFLTHRCNLRCRMCGQWGEGGVTKKQSVQYIQAELTLEELKSIIDDISSFSPNITLFGGEPLLHNHCIEIIKYIKQKGMHCLMITNGFLLENVAEDILESRLDELNVSLDGGRQLHDEIRGMPGLFDKITTGLKKINHLKTQRNQKKPFLNLQCTITKYNYRYLEQLIDVANETGVDSLTFHHLIFLNREIIQRQKEYDNLLGCSSVDWEGFVFEPEIDPQVLYEKIKKILSSKYNFSVDFYPNFSYEAILEYYTNPNYIPFDYPSCCLSPWVVAYVFPDGEVRPCLNFDYSFGNIKNNKFAKIWNGAPAIKYRLILKEKNIFPVCVRCTELYRY